MNTWSTAFAFMIAYLVGLLIFKPWLESYYKK